MPLKNFVVCISISNQNKNADSAREERFLTALEHAFAHVSNNVSHIFAFFFLNTDSADPYRTSGKERKIGLVVARGTSVMTISPLKGIEEIQNPFIQNAEQI